LGSFIFHLGKVHFRLQDSSENPPKGIFSNPENRSLFDFSTATIFDFTPPSPPAIFPSYKITFSAKKSRISCVSAFF